MSFAWLFPYILVSVSVVMIPGPDMVFVLTQSISYGNRAGLTTIMGSVTGTLVHTCLAAAGLSIIIEQSLFAFNVIKIVGALYLLYLAIQSLREREAVYKLESSNQQEKPNGHFKKGLITNLMNPKMPIFFLTFLPQFVDIQLGHESFQIFFLGLIFILETLCIFSLVSLFASKLGDKLVSSCRFQNGIKYFKGSIFGGLGLKLLFLSR